MERVTHATRMALDSPALRLARLAFSDGVFPGLARLALAIVYGVGIGMAILCAAQGADVLGSLVMTAVFLGIVGYIGGWRECVVVAFAPDRALQKTIVVRFD